MRFSGNHYKLGKHTLLTSKHGKDIVKNKGYLNIFKQLGFYNHMELRTMRPFLLGSKFYTRRNNNKVDSVETRRIVIADLLP